MSFIKSKHSGWTWDLKRTPFGGGGGDIVSGIGDAFSGVVDSVDSALVGLDKTVGDVVPGGWGTLGAAAAAVATGGASLGLSAAEVAAADGIALSTYGVPAAEAMATYGIPAAELGLPAAATAADIGAVAGTASAEFAGSELGQQALAMTAPALESGAGATPFQLADGSMGTIQGGNIMDAAGNVVAKSAGANTLGDIIGYAKTGSQIVGGLGKLAGGVMGLNTSNQMKQYAGQADPFAAYRPQYAAQLQNLMNNPNTVTTTPGYQFNLAQGLQGLQAQQAAQGRLVSGGALLQGQQFGQNLAQQTYQQQLQTLAGLSGATQSPATGAAAQAGLTASGLGSAYGGWQSIAGGLGQIANPLATLYSNYNNPSPNPTA
jgi:hypothetical protein